ncbi:D-glycero-beta-D-manno-heptose 1,7-bisphosphate 7-phosphatase [Lysobacter rhizosphaerae]
MNVVAAHPPYLDPGLPVRLAALPTPRRALFLDRDGVINVDHGYVHTPAQTEWVPGIFELVAKANAFGYLPVVVTNQAGIARGYYDEAEFLSYTAWVHDEFRRRGASLAATFYCPHHPDAGLGVLKCDCAFRKPRPGMLLAAASELDIDVASSALVGDKASDIEAAKRAGVGVACLLDRGRIEPSDHLQLWRD